MYGNDDFFNRIGQKLISIKSTNNTNLVIKRRKNFVGNFFMQKAGRSVKKYLAGIFSERASQARRQ